MSTFISKARQCAFQAPTTCEERTRKLCYVRASVPDQPGKNDLTETAGGGASRMAKGDRPRSREVEIDIAASHQVLWVVGKRQLHGREDGNPSTRSAVARSKEESAAVVPILAGRFEGAVASRPERDLFGGYNPRLDLRAAGIFPWTFE